MTTITIDEIQRDLMGYFQRAKAGFWVPEDFYAPRPDDLIEQFKMRFGKAAAIQLCSFSIA